MLAGVSARVQASVDPWLGQHRRVRCKAIPSVDDVHDQVEAIQVVEHNHVERCGGCAALFETAYVHVMVIGAAVGKPMNQPRITVIGKDNRLATGEYGVEFIVGQAMWMFGVGQ